MRTSWRRRGTPATCGSVSPGATRNIFRASLPAATSNRGARDMEGHGRAASTVARHQSRVAGSYRFAVIDGLVEDTPPRM
jgi:hypothetical protein